MWKSVIFKLVMLNFQVLLNVPKFLDFVICIQKGTHCSGCWSFSVINSCFYCETLPLRVGIDLVAEMWYLFNTRQKTKSTNKQAAKLKYNTYCQNRFCCQSRVTAAVLHKFVHGKGASI